MGLPIFIRRAIENKLRNDTEIVTEYFSMLCFRVTFGQNFYPQFNYFYFYRMVGSVTVINRRSARLAANVQQSMSVSHETSCVTTKKRKLPIDPSSESRTSYLEDSDEIDDIDSEGVLSTSTKGSRKQNGKGNTGDEGYSVPISPRKKHAPKPEPVYIIPDVARKETTFRGRLGKSESFMVVWRLSPNPNRICLPKHGSAKQKTCKPGGILLQDLSVCLVRT
jgi:hypothetical protein